MVTTLDIARYAFICGGALVIGFNHAIYKNADRMSRHPKAWRMYLLGNTLLTIFVMMSLFGRIGTSLSWRTPIAGTAVVLTIVGLVLMNESVARQRRRIKREKAAQLKVVSVKQRSRHG